MTVLPEEKNYSQRGIQAEKMDASVPVHGKASEGRSAPTAVIYFIERAPCPFQDNSGWHLLSASLDRNLLEAPRPLAVYFS